jgi:hypothetical protein
MLNGEFLLYQASRLATRVERVAGSDPGLLVARGGGRRHGWRGGSA